MGIWDWSKSTKIEKTVFGILDCLDRSVAAFRPKSGELLFVNKYAVERLGLNPEDLKAGRTALLKSFPFLSDALSRRSPQRVNGKGDAAQESGEPCSTFTAVSNEGRHYSISLGEVLWTDDRPAIICYLSDVEEEHRQKERLYNLAYIDGLTAIPNRQRLREDFEEISGDIAAERLQGILAIFDLDNFKNINDTYGHNTGDLMLRRLTGHLSSDLHFAGHIYRLGGDEFVLLYKYPAGTYESDEAMQEYFEEHLQNAFLSYTMPNIELSCTLSMGISLFPAHGDSYSELLRKADIALYKAKAEGRNRKIFFRDKYDGAKKFKDLYINIQPILVQSGKTFGYELVDRGNEEDGENEVSLTEFDRTLDALGLGDIENDARYFISCTDSLLTSVVVNNLPKNKFIIQIHLNGTVLPGHITNYRKIRALGYSIAFTGLSKKNYSPELLELADYIKFRKNGMTPYDIEKLIKENPGKHFIATDVDTSAQLEAARKQGFKLFQGFFFKESAPPTLKKTKEIDPIKFNYLRLLKLSSAGGYVDFKEISSVISADVALSYKLLKLLNSAAVGLRNVTSISMAVAYLGEDNLKKWIALLALRGLADDKPLELVRSSLIRARFGELLVPNFKIRRDTKEVFLVGLLSLLHIALEKPKEELLSEIPVAEDIRLSLLTKNGIYSDLIDFYKDYEYANWEEVSRFGELNGVDSQTISDCYIESVKWYNSISNV